MTAPIVKTALVTGVSRGIGRATARALVRDGVRVVGSRPTSEKARWITGVILPVDGGSKL